MVRRVTAAATRTGLMAAYPATAEERERFREITHIDPADGWWVRGGYVFPGKPRPGGDEAAGELLTQWATWQGVTAESIKAWYEMRFDGRRRYFLRVDGNFEVIDFGEGGAAER